MAKNKKGYLIEPSDLKEESIIQLNTDEKYLKIAIIEASDLDLEPLIGYEYVKHLNEGWINGTLTDNEKETIRDYIKPFLIYASIVRVIPYLHNKVGNKGVNVSTDATLIASAPRQVDTFIQLINQQMDSYKRRLISYFQTDDDNHTNTNPLADSTSSNGFYIPDKVDNSEQYYKSRASKVNYYRRGW